MVDWAGTAPASRTLFSLLHTAIKNTLREILTPVPTMWELSLIARMNHVPVHKCVKYVLYHRIRALSSPCENQVFAVGSIITGVVGGGV